MYDNGMGPHKVNRFLSDMNIPGISSTALAKREKEVAHAINKVTEASLTRSIQEEKSATAQLTEWYMLLKISVYILQT